MAVSADEGMRTRGRKYSGKNRARAKLLGAGIAVLILLAVVVAAVVWLVSARSHSAQPDKNSPAVAVDPKQPAQTQAVSLEVRGEESEALKVLDQTIAKTTSKTDLAPLYVQRASIEYDAKQYSAALKDAKTAEADSPSAGSSRLIAECSEALGDKATALKYYKLTLSRTPSYAGGNDVLQQKITELGG